MKVIVVYSNPKDKELIELVEFLTPFFIEFIDIKTKNGKKEGHRIKSEFGARKDPFIVVYDNEDKFKQCFWSENGSAVHAFINTYKYGSKV